LGPVYAGGGENGVVGGLPLMPGLAIVPDESVILFGTRPDDQTVAEGLVDVDEVYPFYARVLSQAGWIKHTPRFFTKGHQTFLLEAKSSNPSGRTIVTFTLQQNEP